MTLAYFALPVGLIFIQPNLGMTILFMFIWFIMIWVAGCRSLHDARRVGAGHRDWPFSRCWPTIRRSVSPPFNPEEANADDVFNIDQAEISIGSGGLTGKGYLQGTQSQPGFCAPNTPTSSSVLTEEMGLLGGSVVVLGSDRVILWRPLRGGAQSLIRRPS